MKKLILIAILLPGCAYIEPALEIIDAFKSDAELECDGKCGYYDKGKCTKLIEVEI